MSEIIQLLGLKKDQYPLNGKLRVVGGSIPPKTAEMRVKYYPQYQGHLFFFYNEKKNAASPGSIRPDPAGL